MEVKGIKLPEEINKIIEIAQEKGHNAHLVGGCVRDMLCMREPYDFDITISCPPETTKEIYKDYEMFDIGIKYGTVSVFTKQGIVEITTYRREEGYSDFRHPEKIDFSESLEEDLKRRDFTMNAIAYNETQGFVDLYGGKEDVKNKIIRSVGNPAERFEEDPLRILRGIRFTSSLGFEVEEKTKKEMFNKYELLSNVSVERKRDEFSKMLEKGENISKTLEEYEEIIKFALGVKSLETAKKYIDNADGIIVKTALLLCDEKSTEKVCKNLKYSREMRRMMKVLKEYKTKEIDSSLTGILHLLKEYPYDADLIISLKSALGEDMKEAKTNYRRIKRENICCSLKQLNIKGTDLEKLDLFPKTQYKTVLNYLLDKVIDGEIPNEKESLINKIKTEF